MNTNLHRLKVLSTIFCLVLAACGGGSDGGSASNGAPGSTEGSGSSGGGGTGSASPGTSAGSTATRTVMFEALPDTVTSAEFMAQLNAQGARGFRFISGFYFRGDAAGSQQKLVYVKDAETTYTYEIPQEPATDYQTAISQYESWLNGYGARGFVWNGPYMVGGQKHVLMRKDNGSTSTYTYNVVAHPMNTTLVDFVQNDANARGGNGFYLSALAYQGPFGAAPTVAIYRKDAQSAARYGYEVMPAPASDGDFKAQLNAQGARGYRFKSAFYMGDQRIVYEKDLSQSSSFQFYDLETLQTSSEFLAQANAQGQKGGGLMGGYVMPSGNVRDFYFAPANCSGFLCDTRSLFGL